MKDAKRRLKQRCETDLKHIHDAIQKADLEDAEAMKRFAAMKVCLLVYLVSLICFRGGGVEKRTTKKKKTKTGQE